MYDILFVGAGLSAATACAQLSHRYNIAVVDVRPYLGGNCADYHASPGTYVGLHGPHIFHTVNKDIVEFLSTYTEWIPYVHSVEAEIQLNGLKRVPFPYSSETAALIGDLTSDQIVDTFFRDYSIKMWGKNWEQLPSVIKNRIPKKLEGKSEYFPNQFVGLPKRGYSKMMEKMFHHCTMFLGVDEHFWQTIPAKRIIFNGRLDRIKLSNGLMLCERLRGFDKPWLDYRSVVFTLKQEAWDSERPVVNFCHRDVPFTRKTSYGSLYGTRNSLVAYEQPIAAYSDEINPYYPVPEQTEYDKHAVLKASAIQQFPNLSTLGRIGTHKYMDMDAAVGQGLKLAHDIISSN